MDNKTKHGKLKFYRVVASVFNSSFQKTNETDRVTFLWTQTSLQIL